MICFRNEQNCYSFGTVEFRWCSLIGPPGRLLFWSMIALFLGSCAHLRPPPPVKEARGVWLHRFDYCQVTSSHDQDSIKAYIATVIRQAADANFNMIIFQVRGNGDAYYTPGLEPWGNLLTGQLGDDPGWDPLEFAVEQAHQHGLELHAWFNTFPAWRGSLPPPETTPRSPYLEHPQWIVSDSSGNPMPLSDHYLSFSPGIPGVHEHILAVVLDVTRRYDIDGIHFDYIRYPDGASEAGYSRDSISVARYHSIDGNPLQLDWDDWQREQITHFIAKAYAVITALKPWVKVSAAVIGSYNAGGWNAYHAVYQDPRRWTELGKVDFIAPMIYWPRRGTSQPFLKRSLEWRDNFTLERYVFPGIGSYRYNTAERPYHWSEALGQIKDLRKHHIRGMLFFDARSLENRWHDLAATLYRHPANIPPMPWKDPTPPQPPSHPAVIAADNELMVTWVTPEDDDIQRFNIYAARELPLDRRDGRQLLAVTLGPRLEHKLDISAGELRGAYLAVSAVDYAGNESELSPSILVNIPE